MFLSLEGAGFTTTLVSLGVLIRLAGGPAVATETSDFLFAGLGIVGVRLLYFPRTVHFIVLERFLAGKHGILRHVEVDVGAGAFPCRGGVDSLVSVSEVGHQTAQHSIPLGALVAEERYFLWTGMLLSEV